MVMTDGVHGPVLGPVEMLVINVVLITICFFLLCRPTHSAKREILVLTSITAAAAASRVLLEPFPNVQPLTVMCLVMGASLGSSQRNGIRSYGNHVLESRFSRTVGGHYSRQQVGQRLHLPALG